MTPSPPPPRRRNARIAIVLLCSGAGCGLLRGPTITPTEFYVLSALPQAADRPGDAREIVLGLGPVTLPPYLNRPEMASRVAPNQLRFDEFNRWAEPLKDNFFNVLATELDAQLGLERIVRYPWYSTTTMDYVVVVAVQRFEAQPSGEVTLDARWGIGDGKGTTLANRDSHFSRPGGSPAVVAAAMSALVSDLAGEIATALQQTSTTRRPHKS
jgi:uncharacterized lipoprotein YmbA